MCQTNGYCVGKCEDCKCQQEEATIEVVDVTDLCPHCGLVDSESTVCSECGRHKE